MNILIAGGNGFIGSHTYISLRERFPEAQLVIVDNLANSTLKTLENLRKITGEHILFYEMDLCDEQAVAALFQNYPFDGVIHFAGYKAVGESVVNPIKYYTNNLNSTLHLVKYCLAYEVNKFVFSSSATVYGDGVSPLMESDALLPASNPYGQTKAMCEQILIDVARANPEFSVALLRYFNPVGAHESGLMGEAANGVPTNLMPYITKVAKGELPILNIFGGDYPTVDGTGVRDYIHVMDLAEGHAAALEHLTPGVHIYNLGTGKGTSVLQLVKAFEEVTGVKVPYQIMERRPGDLATVYANVSKAEKELNWKAKRTIKEMCRDAWRFEKHDVLI
ncbi:UDP-glucose 4-epimerase GalE [Lysinibacillus sp. KU-BSD001]|uniref:UDP-glucose 4-epimerase GalE n=1 Tax=Lysinibacillus sp. KU-BSD001 TaxID=3141328 RepID=UPI0036E9C3FB